MTTLTTDKSLARFLEVVYTNQQGNRANFPKQYRLIQRVDDCFVKATENLVDPKPVLTGPLFFRSQYAYKTAAGMTLAGQVTESFVMMRSCLEYAGYALAIFADPRLDLEGAPSREVVFVNRHVDDLSMKAQKKEFQIANIHKTITSVNQNLANWFKFLYARSIDCGGHPNPHGMFITMTIDKTNEETVTGMTTLALTTDVRALAFAMQCVAQVGLTSLYIFQHIFNARFELLGILPEMDVLRKETLCHLLPP